MRIFVAFFLALLLTSGQASICEMCIKTSVHLQNLLITLAPEKPAREVVQAVCQRQYESKELCLKVSRELTPLAITMGVRGVVKTGRMCQALCPQGFYTPLNLEKQVAAIIEGKQGDSMSNLEQLSVQTQNLKVGNGKTKLMHMTDVHLDLNYTENASVICDFPICCHAQHGFPQANASKAPEYGSVHCDTPLKLFESALEYIQSQVPEVDAALITGDFSAHNQWEKTPQSVVEMRTLVEDKLKEVVQTTLISAPGNNEYMPDHQVDPTAVPEESIKVVQISNDDGKKLTFVVLNTLFCDNINLYLIQDQTMPIRQIKTLSKILEEKENVYILGHIEPTSHSCSEIYGTLFRAVLTRHSKKIKGQFYGHTHMDQFVVNTDPRDNKTATSFGMLAGSLTPLGTHLPRFRVYQLNSEFEITNYDDYAFNMKISTWGLNYNFKNYYGLPIDQPVDAALMKKLQQKILNDENMVHKFKQKVGFISTNNQKGCESFDTRDQENLCLGEYADFRQKIDQLLKMIQGPWGSYGDRVQ